MRLISWDIEANAFLQDATKIHCLCYKDLNGDLITLTDDFTDIFKNGDTWICHNQFSYDLPLLVKLGHIQDFTADSVTYLDGTTVNVQFIDTLALSREWFPDLPRGHGLEPWAKELGTYKPHIDDWKNLDIGEYITRCEEDVLTTEKLFLYLADKLEIDYE